MRATRKNTRNRSARPVIHTGSTGPAIFALNKNTSELQFFGLVSRTCDIMVNTKRNTPLLGDRPRTGPAVGTSPWLDLQPGVAPPTRQVAAAEPLGHHALQLLVIGSRTMRAILHQNLLRPSTLFVLFLNAFDVDNYGRVSIHLFGQLQ